MQDLLEIHYERLRDGEASLCPAFWLNLPEVRSAIQRLLYLDKELPITIGGTDLDSANKLKLLDTITPYCENLGQIKAHPKIAGLYRVSPLPNHKMEEGVRAKILFKNPDMKWEVNTPVGRIDCMNSNEIVEIKSAKKWKEGIGQLMSYGYFYPKHRRILHLYGYVKPEVLKNVVKVCEKIDIRVQKKC